MSNIQVGSYVQYKNSPYILCEIRTNDTVVLVSPDHKKVVVGSKSITPTTFRPCVTITHAGNKYLVTRLSLIISLTTCKVMNWSTKHGSRLAIIKLAKEQW